MATAAVRREREEGALHTFTVEQYMALDIPERTELLEGLIYDLSPRNEPHRYAVRKLGKTLARALNDEYIVQIQDTLAVPDWQGANGPDPDIVVLRDKPFGLVPTSADAVAVIEVSDTTYGGSRGDREFKVPLYLNAGVPAWIVNVPLRQVECYRSVADLDLKHGHVVGLGDRFEILGVKIPVAELFEAEPQTPQ